MSLASSCPLGGAQRSDDDELVVGSRARRGSFLSGSCLPSRSKRFSLRKDASDSGGESVSAREETFQESGVGKERRKKWAVPVEESSFGDGLEGKKTSACLEGYVELSERFDSKKNEDDYNPAVGVRNNLTTQLNEKYEKLCTLRELDADETVPPLLSDQNTSAGSSPRGNLLIKTKESMREKLSISRMSEKEFDLFREAREGPVENTQGYGRCNGAAGFMGICGDMRRAVPEHLDDFGDRKTFDRPENECLLELDTMSSLEGLQPEYCYNEAQDSNLAQTIKNNYYIPFLFLFLPLAFIVHEPLNIFAFSVLSIIPLAWIIGKCTKNIAANTGPLFGGLINATFGSAVEILFCVTGIRQGELALVKTTLIGSIVSNMLLVMGCSFFLGGLKHKEQRFSGWVGGRSASLLATSCLCFGLPTVFDALVPTPLPNQLRISRLLAFFLILNYAFYIIYEVTNQKEPVKRRGGGGGLPLVPSFFLLIGATYLAAVLTEPLIESVDWVVTNHYLSRAFIGMFLLPIVGNAVEHLTAIGLATENQIELSLSCSVGSACQMSMFVTPICVLAAWWIGQPLTLHLHMFEVVILLLTVLIVTRILQYGRSNWLEGYTLMSSYFCIGVIYFFQDKAVDKI